MVSRILFSSLSDQWATPKTLYEALNKEFQFEFDPCPMWQGLADFDGLHSTWKNRNFVNPPYSHVKEWVKKGYIESLKGKLCVFLVASRTDTKWFHDYVLPFAKEVRFIKGRLRFNGSSNSAPFPSCVIVFDGRKQLEGERHG
jgi:site-specific DNA-methyltransferase (adenine-specific)